MIITQMVGDGLSPFFNPKTYMGREKMADEILNEDNNEQETGMVTLSEAKAYLRVDSSYEDALISNLLVEQYCRLHRNKQKESHHPVRGVLQA